MNNATQRKSSSGSGRLSGEFGLYRQLKPYMPLAMRLWMGRQQARLLRRRHQETWPIDEHAANSPPEWTGWPNGKRFAFVLTHDVEEARGVGRCRKLLEMETNRGFRSCFYLAPGRYGVTGLLREELAEAGAEVGIYGLHHDGQLLSDPEGAEDDATTINWYMKKWKATGFRSPGLPTHSSLMQSLDIRYDSSSVDTGPFLAPPASVNQIYPFWVPCEHEAQKGGYVELPITIPDDYTLFILLREKHIDVWRRKLDWVAEHGGLALVLTHPDYMNFERGGKAADEYSGALYLAFLEYVAEHYKDQYWQALPGEVAAWY